MQKRHPLVRLAKISVDSYIVKGETIAVPGWIPDRYLEKAAGTFVTIKKNSDLRGCVGTYAPTKENIAKEIIFNAISAAARDSRFDKVTVNELPGLEYEIYILKEPEPVSGISELDPETYGLIVQTAGSCKCGLLLPGLEGIDMAEQQIAIACQKAGIDPKRETLSFFRFQAEKIK